LGWTSVIWNPVYKGIHTTAIKQK